MDFSCLNLPLKKEKLDLKYKNLHFNQISLYICPVKSDE